MSDFYVPALERATRYDRAVGYFTSSSLALITSGVDGLVRNGGRIRLIASPYLTSDDIAAISQGYELRDIIDQAVARTLVSPESQETADLTKLAQVSRLIADGTLEIKIAIVRRDHRIALYHEKVGLIGDAYGDRIAFSGSMNETSAAYSDNFESIEVFKSWVSSDLRRVDRIAADFESLWAGKTPRVETFEFPKLAREYLEKLARKLPEIDRPPLFSRPSGSSNSQNQDGWATLPDQISLRRYQSDAVEDWFATGRRGIFQMATGTGKTITALAVLSEVGKVLREHKKSLLTVIVVPLLDLVEQWSQELLRFGVVPLKCRDSASTWEPQARNMIAGIRSDTSRSCTLIVTNKAFGGSAFQTLLRNTRVPIFIIADEAHHLGAEHLRSTLPDQAGMRLALSATPERWFDEEGTEALSNYFGKTLVSLGLKEAIDLGALTPYRYWPVLVPLTDNEAALYYELTAKIGALYGKRLAGKQNKFEDSALDQLLNKRAKVLGHAELKIPTLRDEVLKRRDLTFQLVYCAEGGRPAAEGSPGPGQVEQVLELLGNDLGMRVHPYTSHEPKEKRRDLLRAFGTGNELEALVSMRCLDEGVDIPDARVAYMLASSSNPRQFIQRRGRILRRAPGKRSADVIDFISVPPRDPDLYSIEQKLFRREIARFVEFAKYSMNYGEALAKLREPREYYSLMDM
ncbi:DEAD/DEAH box helicase family protein [Acrocarpospora phusangensis]|uniref:DEAD/DEAH box helicase family protein n=1 Tax=Acrocarpospora phusangensis TaxID=1070424 RepID=UPI00194DF500|nr:DEAD/DEAH box helicase family protein [Acrocarpospora phusangensis]